MKLFFFLVALANLMLFLWEYNRNVYLPIDRQYEAVAPSEREVILLESELKKEPKDEMINDEENQNGPSANSVSVKDNEVIDNKNQEAFLSHAESEIRDITQTGENEPGHCYQAGPFTSGDVIKIWRSRLNASGATAKFVSREEKIINDYVVYYPAADKIEETEANVQMLKSHGLNEFWIKRTGDEKGQILLGIFSREERALKMKNELKAKGINAELKSRYQNKVNRYALIRTEEKTLNSLDDLKSAYPNIPVNPLARPSESCLVDSIEDSQSSHNPPATEIKKDSEALTSPAVKGGALSESNKPGSGQESGNIQVTDKTSNNPNSLQTCYKVGPFNDEKLLQNWNKQVAADDLEIKPLAIEEKTVSDYLVYYPATNTPEQSAANMQMLKSKGLTDIWMVRMGDEKGMISLGVFSKEQRAKMLKNQLRAKGVNAEIKPRYKTKLVKYLVVNGGSKVKDSLKTLEKNYPGVIAKPIQNCLGSKSGN